MNGSHLADLRAELARARTAGFHRAARRRASGRIRAAARPSGCAWLTGFTGSAGLAVVLAGRAALFVDGRYTLQAAAQVDTALFERRHIIDEPPAALARRRAGRARASATTLAASPRRRCSASCAPAATMVRGRAATRSTRSGTDQPPPPLRRSCRTRCASPAEQRGQARRHRRRAGGARRRGGGADRSRHRSPGCSTSAAATCRIRRSRSPSPSCAPMARCTLFIDRRKLPAPTRAHLGKAVAIAARAALPAALDALAGQAACRSIRRRRRSWFATGCARPARTVVAGTDPCLLPKACKNAVELAGHPRRAPPRRRRALRSSSPGSPRGARRARRRDRRRRRGCRRFRARGEHFRDLSFPDHLRRRRERRDRALPRRAARPNRPIRAGELYLVDSGAQYLDGTTDITRTVSSPGTPPRGDARPLHPRAQGPYRARHGALPARARPARSSTRCARRALWQAGLDYDHGTGHGVGSYLSVHEGPQRISQGGQRRCRCCPA